MGVWRTTLVGKRQHGAALALEKLQQRLLAGFQTWDLATPAPLPGIQTSLERLLHLTHALHASMPCPPPSASALGVPLHLTEAIMLASNRLARAMKRGSPPAIPTP